MELGPKGPFSEERVTRVLDPSQIESWTILEECRKLEAEYDGVRGRHLGTTESRVIFDKSWRL